MLVKPTNLKLLIDSVCHQSKRGLTLKKWRKLTNRPQLPSMSGPLTDLPDWSYTDGRGYGPPTIGQKKRYKRDQEMAQKIVQWMPYMEGAKRMGPNKK